jgi:hypothetical protein
MPLLGLNMASSIIRKNLSEYRRERRYELGQQGEINVGNLLADHFGHRKISWGFEGYSEGTNGFPDLVIKTLPPIAIEVKSISPFTVRKKNDSKGVGYVAIRREQWVNQLKFARDKNAKLILVVEVRLKDKGIYFWFTSDQVDRYMKKLKGERVHISLWDVMSKARSLIYPDELQYLEYWGMNIATKNDNKYQGNIV